MDFWTDLTFSLYGAVGTAVAFTLLVMLSLFLVRLIARSTKKTINVVKK